MKAITDLPFTLKTNSNGSATHVVMEASVVEAKKVRVTLEGRAPPEATVRMVDEWKPPAKKEDGKEKVADQPKEVKELRERTRKALKALNNVRSKT